MNTIEYSGGVYFKLKIVTHKFIIISLTFYTNYKFRLYNTLQINLVLRQRKYICNKERFIIRRSGTLVQYRSIWSQPLLLESKLRIIKK